MIRRAHAVTPRRRRLDLTDGEFGRIEAELAKIEIHDLH